MSQHDSSHQSAGLNDRSPDLHLAVFWRKKWVLMASAVVAAGLAAAYISLAPAVYEAQCRLLVQKHESGLAGDVPYREDRQFLATQAEIIHSRLIVREALHSPRLARVDLGEDPVETVLELLHVSPLINTDVLRISYRAGDPDHAATLVEELRKAYQGHIQQTETADTRETLSLLTGREGDLRQELQSLQEKYARHRKDSPLVGHDQEAVRVDAELLREFGHQLAEARGRRVSVENVVQALDAAAVAAEERRARLARVGNATIPVSVERPTAPRDTLSIHLLRGIDEAIVKQMSDLQAEWRAARARERELAQVYGTNHPERKGAAQLIADLDRLINEHHRLAEITLQQELAVAKQTETNLQRIYQTERDRVKELDNFLVRERQFQDNLRRVETLHDTTLARLGTLQLADGALAQGQSSVSVRVLDGSQEKIWPKPALLLAVCAFLGLCGGAVWVWLTSAAAVPVGNSPVRSAPADANPT